jgi:Zn-dependent M16 (insulinase) family peptidase
MNSHFSFIVVKLGDIPNVALVMDGPDIPSDMIPALSVFDMYCVRMHCHAEGSHLITDNLFGQHINT